MGYKLAMIPPEISRHSPAMKTGQGSKVFVTIFLD
jgi:hypothetical protein